MYGYAPNKKCIARDWIFTFDYIINDKTEQYNKIPKDKNILGQAKHGKWD